MSGVVVTQVPPNNFISQVSISAGWLCHENEFLFLQKAIGVSEALYWGVPAGKIESNETPHEALVREIFEESNISLSSDGVQYIDTLYISKPGWNFIYHMFFYRFKSKPELKISKEHHDYAWVNLKTIMNYTLMPGTIETLKIFLDRAKELGLI